MPWLSALFEVPQRRKASLIRVQARCDCLPTRNPWPPLGLHLIIHWMPYLVDGNNLLFALKKAGLDVARSVLCALVARLAQSPRPRTGGRASRPSKREDVTVVFDGPPPHGPLAQQIEVEGVRIVFAAPEPADAVIMREIAEDSAPRRLIVVSTDRQIRQAARRRRCVIRLSEDFVQDLLTAADAPAHKTTPEMREKYQGLSEAQTRQWIKEFGLEE